MPRNTNTPLPVQRPSAAERRARRAADLNEQLSRFRHLPDEARVRQPVVLAILSVGSTTLWRRTRAGQFPAPIRVGNTSTWRVGDLRKALAGAEAAS